MQRGHYQGEGKQCKTSGAHTGAWFLVGTIINSLVFIQGEVDKLESSILSVKLELEETRQEKNYDKKRLESLSADIAQQLENNQQLAKSLKITQQEV